MYEAQINDQSPIAVDLKGTTPTIGEVDFKGEVIRVDDRTFRILRDGAADTVHVLAVQAEEKKVLLKVNGKKVEVALSTEMDRLLKRMGIDNQDAGKVSEIKAPMPGLIHAISVAIGDEVAKGDALLILEAMKMENVIKSPTDGKVKSIHVEVGNTVDKGKLMISFE